MQRHQNCIDCGVSIPARAKRCNLCAHEERSRRSSLRRAPNMSEKLAAAILVILDIPHEQAKSMSTKSILQLVEWDHYPVAVNTARDLGWTVDQVNHPSNLQPLTKAGHLLKTRTVDTPQAAKAKRLVTSEQEHARRRMLAPDKTEDQPKPKRKSQWPKGRKLQGRPFPTKENRNGKHA